MRVWKSASDTVPNCSVEKKDKNRANELILSPIKTTFDLIYFFFLYKEQKNGEGGTVA